MAIGKLRWTPADREKTVFASRHGLFGFQVMPFGLCNAPGTFQTLMEFVLAGLQWQTCLVYLDDIIVCGRDFDEHLERLREVFNRFHQADLKVARPSKCFHLRPIVPYLGLLNSAEISVTDLFVNYRLKQLSKCFFSKIQVAIATR